jgi:ribonuclease T1
VPAVAVLLVGVLVIAFAWWLARPERDVDGALDPGSVTSATADAPSGISNTPTSGLPTVPESRLPEEAQRVLSTVRAGGPFDYREDGATFGNREVLLPVRAYGYYREYTVPTPGETDRGPRRLVVGQRGDVYWTTDHYASFQQVDVNA